MRKRALLGSIGMAAVLCLALIHQPGSAQAAGSGGDFIVRCFFNGNVATMDPILDPGSTTTDHMHVFFGNLIQGTPSFPSIKSGDGGRPNTMELGSNGLPQATNCQDTQDTAGYWQPEPYLNGAPYLGPFGGCTTSCDPGRNMHLRVYYLPNATPNANQAQQQIQEIPDGSILVAGFPNGCNGVTGHGCTSGGFPSDMSIVRYTCGADTKVGVTTPVGGGEVGFRDPENDPAARAMQKLWQKLEEEHLVGDLDDAWSFQTAVRRGVGSLQGTQSALFREKRKTGIAR